MDDVEAPDPLHSEATLARFRAPTHQGRLAGPGVLRGRAGDPAKGRALALDLTLSPDGSQVLSARFRAYGCPATVAVADLVCELAAGQAPQALAQLPLARIEAELGLPPERRGCILLAEDALRAALASRGAAPIEEP